jgi:hypothetical protein
VVKGLDRFRKHFMDFADRYVLIGGTACDLAFAEVGIEFRSTRDLDIVLCIEALDADFGRAFWEFVQQGGYASQESSTSERKFYRFSKPTNGEFPVMLELFSRVPDALNIATGSALTPIPIDDAISSLSAILPDAEYYDWIRAGRREIDGIPAVSAAHLLPLKAKAWLDLRQRKLSGQTIDSRDINKHKNDVFRLYSIIAPAFRAATSGAIAADMREFVHAMRSEPVDLKSLGMAKSTKEAVLSALAAMYRIGGESA